MREKMSKKMSVGMLPGEHWYGGACFDGIKMPFSGERDFVRNLNPNSTMNQAAPLLLSDKGRYIWSDASLRGETFRQGDVVETLITCADGAVISLKLDTTLPHAYSRELTVSGTKGMYTEQGNIVLEEGTPFDHEKDMSEYYNTAAKYEEKYLPDIWKNITEKEIAAGHGGMDTLMLRDFFDAAAEGREMPIDVYDAASWMSVSCLSEISVRNNGHPVEIPDFTGGEWLLRN